MKWEHAKGLIIVHAVFQCGYCGKQWGRGGKKEGFVKSAANNHAFLCFEIDLYKRGLMLNGKMKDFAYGVVPLSRERPGYARIRRAFLKRVPLRERLQLHGLLESQRRPT